jgi:hypothetical protein
MQVSGNSPRVECFDFFWKRLTEFLVGMLELRREEQSAVLVVGVKEEW